MKRRIEHVSFECSMSMDQSTCDQEMSETKEKTQKQWCMYDY